MSKRLQLGFTLVELLAVLLILAVLALITTPVILNVLKNANEKTFLETAYSINKAANNYYTTLATSNNKVPLLVTYNKGEITSTTADGSKNDNYLDYTGTHPYSGNVYISSTGEVEMAIYDNRSNICVEKKNNDKTPYINEDKSAGSCKLNKTISK